MTEFQNEIKSWVHRTEQELEVSQKILEGNRETMENSQRDLDNATARYEEAVSDSKIPKAGVRKHGTCGIDMAIANECLTSVGRHHGMDARRVRRN